MWEKTTLRSELDHLRQVHLLEVAGGHVLRIFLKGANERNLSHKSKTERTCDLIIENRRCQDMQEASVPLADAE